MATRNVEADSGPTSPASFRDHFSAVQNARIALEVGTRSPWSSHPRKLGHQVVANPRTLALIHSSNRKRDELDAESWLVWQGSTRSSCRRSATAAKCRPTGPGWRDALVRTRTQLITHVRCGQSFGIKLPSCASTCFWRVLEHLPRAAAVKPDSSLKVISQIYEMNKDLNKLAKEHYRNVQTQASCRVGPICRSRSSQP